MTAGILVGLLSYDLHDALYIVMVRRDCLIFFQNAVIRC